MTTQLNIIPTDQIVPMPYLTVMDWWTTNDMLDAMEGDGDDKIEEMAGEAELLLALCEKHGLPVKKLRERTCRADLPTAYAFPATAWMEHMGGGFLWSVIEEPVRVNLHSTKQLT